MAQKLAQFLYALTLPNINLSSKLYHSHSQEKICNNTITKDPTNPHCVVTFPLEAFAQRIILADFFYRI